jgi:hypothetical protein
MFLLAGLWLEMLVGVFVGVVFLYNSLFTFRRTLLIQIPAGFLIAANIYNTWKGIELAIKYQNFLFVSDLGFAAYIEQSFWGLFSGEGLIFLLLLITISFLQTRMIGYHYNRKRLFISRRLH